MRISDETTVNIQGLMHCTLVNIPSSLTHTNPDSWERIADELEEWSEDNRVNGSGEVFDRASIFADRIRKLAKKGE